MHGGISGNKNHRSVKKGHDPVNIPVNFVNINWILIFFTYLFRPVLQVYYSKHLVY